MERKLKIKELLYSDELGTERFKYLDEYKEYLISNYGRVYSLKNDKFLKPEMNSNDYPRISIYHNNIRKHILLHIAVVKTFGDLNLNTFEMLDKELTFPTIDHIDRNRTNCKQNNLEIVDLKENIRRKYLPFEELPRPANMEIKLEEIF